MLSGGVGPITGNSKVRPRLLLIAGGLDRIADPGMTKPIYEKQRQATSPTGFRLFAERSHWTCIEPGWEEVADTALGWAEQVVARTDIGSQASFIGAAV